MIHQGVRTESRLEPNLCKGLAPSSKTGPFSQNCGEHCSPESRCSLPRKVLAQRLEGSEPSPNSGSGTLPSTLVAQWVARNVPPLATGFWERTAHPCGLTTVLSGVGDFVSDMDNARMRMSGCYGKWEEGP